MNPLTTKPDFFATIPAAIEDHGLNTLNRVFQHFAVPMAELLESDYLPAANAENVQLTIKLVAAEFRFIAGIYQEETVEVGKQILFPEYIEPLEDEYVSDADQLVVDAMISLIHRYYDTIVDLVPDVYEKQEELSWI